MQGIGYLTDTVTGEKILCLVRQGTYGRYLKRRKSGSDGIHLTDEETFLNLNEERERIERLKNFQKVFC
jgi:topoisomerase IA-like protein